jgi:hypothetical protein
MPGNHLIIGLGGTGGRIIRELRKTLASVPAERLAGTHYEFLYVDSDPAMMKPDDPEWRVLGRSVQLDRRQTLHIGGMSTAPLLHNLEAYPHLRSWLGDIGQMRRFLDANVNPQAAAQRRRYGRLLFANGARDFVSAAGQLKLELSRASGLGQLTVHLCCGLAGGTGGGSVVDATVLLRRHVATQVVASGGHGEHGGEDRLLLYLVPPEQLPKRGWASAENLYHANGYAALAELNALATGRYRPADVHGDGRPAPVPQPAFNGAYVVQNQNAAGRMIDPEHALPQIIADFIFHKTISAQTAEVLRAENAENGDFADEPSVDGKDLHERSKRFLTFGIQRLVVPTEEIHEYFTYHHAHAVARQCLYNHWSNGVGFVDRRQNIDFNAVVADPARLGGWLLSDEHLTLSRPILATDGLNAAGKLTWQTVVQFWPAVANAAAVDIKASRHERKEGWVTLLQNTLEQIYAQGYRGAGVPDFYRQKGLAAETMAEQIRRQVEGELIAAWRDGRWGFADLQGLLEALVRHVDARLKAAPGQVAALGERAERSRAALVEVVQRNAELGAIAAALLNRREALLDAAKEHLCAMLMQRTMAEGWLFAQTLLPAVLRQLNGLLAQLGELHARLQRAATAFEHQFNSRLEAAGSESEGQEHKTRLFERGRLDGIRDRMLANEAQQRADAQQVREALFGELGSQADFAGLLLRFHEAALQERLEALCDTAARRAADQLAPAERSVLTPNIVEKLAQQYGGEDSRLAAFVLDKVRAAAPYGQFDRAEMAKSGPGTSGGVSDRQTCCVIAIPEAPKAVDFRATLERSLRGQFNATDIVKFQSEGVPANEVTIYQIDNLFPLRWLTHVAWLRERYEHSVRDNPTVRYFVHGAGEISDYPPLFVPSAGELSVELSAHVVAAFAAGLLSSRRNEATGQTALVCRYTDSDGFLREIAVGGDERDALTRMPTLAALQIKERVEARLADEAYRRAEAREQLFQAMVTFVNDYRDRFLKGDPADETYLRLSRQTLRARTRLLQLA